jgi:hypothetical protein
MGCAAVVVTLVEQHELETLQVTELGEFRGQRPLARSEPLIF